MLSSVTTIVLSLSLLASQTLAAPNASGPSKHARWVQVPRTLLDPDFLKRDNLGAREAVGFSPLEKKELVKRQGACTATEVACTGNSCCPDGFNCYYTSGVAGCCPVGQTCSGLPVGCADPNSLECPASIGGCCPIGQSCYLDSTGVAACDPTGQLGTTPAAAPPATTPIATPNITTPSFTPVLTTPIATPVFSTPTQSSTKAGDDGPATVTVAGFRSGAEKVVATTGMGALAVLMGAFVSLA